MIKYSSKVLLSAAIILAIKIAIEIYLGQIITGARVGFSVPLESDKLLYVLVIIIESATAIALLGLAYKRRNSRV